jgi:catechol 2,3-dioxygenase-like lactoylglutathione lyase family enzyme
MSSRLWNIGLKADDMTSEMGFLQQLGAKVLLHETLSGPDGETEYSLLELYGTRVLVGPKPVYEDRLGYRLNPGLTHAVFEVDDLDTEFARIAALGARVLIAPTEISAGFGSRRIAFFCSPGGFIFEVMQILESKI